MYPKWRGFCGIFTLAASLIPLGCGNTGNSNTRAVNASPGLSNFSVYVGQIGIAAALPYGTEGIQPPGKYSTNDTSGNYRIIGAGANQPISILDQTNKPLTTGKQSFLKNGYYTIVSLGTAPAIQIQVLTDNNTAPQSGAYKLRFMDASAAAGPVDVYIVPVGGVPSGTPIIGNAKFQQVTSYLQESPGTLAIFVTSQSDPANVLAVAPFSPAAGSIYSVFFLDPNPAQDPPNVGPTGYGISVVHDPVGTATTMSSGT